MSLKKKLLLLTILIGSFGNAQETVSIMYYNLLKFPNTNSSRITYLKTIVQHVLPDIFVVNELTSSTGSNNILNNALNQNGITYYNAAQYISGPDDNNMLYYNSNKFGLVSQDVIETSLRDINEYVLYYKDPNLTASSDTVYFYIYGAHLKAGNDQSDANQRAAETATLKSHLLTRDNPENTIVGGDFNIYYSSESAYYNLVSSTQANLYDVLGSGAWHNNSAYSSIFTQSTRTTSFDGGATGGMDDRFDFILFSDDLINAENGAQYVNGSYNAIGQDGNRWNGSLVSPTNNSEPTEIINALYYMSDHLPVYMEMLVGGNVGVEEYALNQLVDVYPNPTDGETTVASFEAEIESYTITDQLGREVYKLTEVNALQSAIPQGTLASGTYLVKINTVKGQVIKRLSVK